MILVTPWNIPVPSSHPGPVTSYAGVEQRISELQAREPPGMNPDCRFQLLTHGAKTARALILVHGYTTCPAQFQLLVQGLRLGFATRDVARQAKPAAKKWVVVFNAAGESVNNALTEEMVQTWRNHQADLSTYTFDASLKLPRDLIDPNQEGQKIDWVYPRNAAPI